jgi:hypothetical protein
MEKRSVLRIGGLAICDGSEYRLEDVQGQGKKARALLYRYLPIGQDANANR